WACDDRPAGAVPTLDQHVEGPVAVADLSDGEAAGGAGARNAVQRCSPPTDRVGVGARDDRPAGAVQTLNQRDVSVRAPCVADGEAAGGAGARHAVQRAGRTRTWGYRPVGAVPTLNQRAGPGAVRGNS